MGEFGPRRILVITHFYPPETGAASHRVAAFARELADRGHDVTVLTTFPTWPTGLVPAQYRRRIFATMKDGPITVRMVRAFASPDFSKRNRILTMLTAPLACLVGLMSLRRRFHLVCISSPPVTLAPVGILASILNRAPLVADIRDVWPEVAIRIGEWKERSLIAKVVGKVADALYRRSKLVVCVTETCRDAVIKRGVNPDKVKVIANGFDVVKPALSVYYRPPHGRFIASYTGNLGSAIGASIILDAAARLRGDERFHFVLVGDGAEREHIAERIARDSLTNISMLGALSRAETFAIQELSDVCIVPLRRGIEDSLPTKMLDAMALRRAVIVCADGEARRFVEESGGGVAVAPEDADALIEALARFHADEHLLKLCAERGFNYVRERYDRRDLAKHMGNYVCAFV